MSTNSSANYQTQTDARNYMTNFYDAMAEESSQQKSRKKQNDRDLFFGYYKLNSIWVEINRCESRIPVTLPSATTLSRHGKLRRFANVVNIRLARLACFDPVSWQRRECSRLRHRYRKEFDRLKLLIRSNYQSDSTHQVIDPKKNGAIQTETSIFANASIDANQRYRCRIGT